MKIRFDNEKIVIVHNLCFDAFYTFDNVNDYFKSERKALESYGFIDGEKQNESVFNGTLLQLALFITETNFKKLDNEITKYSLDEFKKIKRYLVDNHEEILNAPFDKKHGYYNFKDFKLRLCKSLLDTFFFSTDKELEKAFVTEYSRIYGDELERLTQVRERNYERDLPKLQERQMQAFVESPCFENFCYVKDDSKCLKCAYFSEKPKTNLLNIQENFRNKLSYKY